MRLLFVLDHFGSGGAQRQMVALACGLKDRGHEIEFLIYYPDLSFFRDIVRRRDILVHEIVKGRGFSLAVVQRLAGLLRSEKYDAVLSFMRSPNIYAELTHILTPSTPLVVSERGSHFGDQSWVGAWMARSLHRLADRVVANSQSHKLWLAQHFRWMRSRLSVIYNGVDVKSFHANTLVPVDRRQLRLVAIGRVAPLKNATGVVQALRAFSQKHGWVPQMTWVGRFGGDTKEEREYCREAESLLESSPELRGKWAWAGQRDDVVSILEQSHALIHPSFHEGLPNAICEALAAGRPVLASDVCDNGLLVPEKIRGALFDPYDPESLVDAIERILAQSDADWVRMGRECRRYAEEELSLERCVDKYEHLFRTLACEGDPREP